MWLGNRKCHSHDYTQLPVILSGIPSNLPSFWGADQKGRDPMINFCKLTKLTCPHHSMATYIALASPKDPYTTPLFWFTNDRPLPRLGLLKYLHCQFHQAGYHPHRYNTHSFRFGGANSAGEAGVSQANIQQLGRWGHSQAYQHYIRPPQKAPALWEPTATAGRTSASSTSTRIDSRLHCRRQHQWNTCPQQDRNTGSSSQVHKHFIFHCSLYLGLFP